MVTEPGKPVGLSANVNRTSGSELHVTALGGAKEVEQPDISVIVPVYREEKSIRPFLERVEPILECIGSYEILFCYDPSPDQTKEVILEEILRNPRIRLLSFSRRFGQPAACVPLAAAYKLGREGVFSPDDIVVCIVSGSGLKYTAALEKHSFDVTECSLGDLPDAL